MKKLYSIAFSALALFALSTACSKEEKSIAENNGTKPAAEKITISATLSDVLTKVAYTDSDGAGLTLAWEKGDKLLVVNHANPSDDAQEFTLLPEDIGKQTGHFTGTLPAGATVFDVSVVHATTDYSVQTQPKDGDLSALELIAYAEEVDDITNFSLTDHSSILKIEAKLPVDVAGTITSVQIKAIDINDITGATPSNIFFGGNTLTINLTAKGDVDNDNILKLYATIPDKDSDPSNTAFIIKFISDSEHSEYTRFVVLKDGATLDPMAVHTLKINCSNIDKHAGVKDADGSENKPYLIADKYQMQAMNSLMVRGETTYFQLLSDIDLDGVQWISLNNEADEGKYNKYINFDGNGHTISNLTPKNGYEDQDNMEYPSLFGVLNGTVKNLVIDKATITPGNKKGGVLAGYIGSGDSEVTCVVDNITITNSTVGTSAQKAVRACGVLCSWIAKEGGNISNITISDCVVASSDYAGGMLAEIDAETTISGINTVTNTNVYGTLAGGVVGFANAKTTMSGCTYSGGTVTATARYCGGMVGSTGNFDSVISDCHVESATIEAGSDRAGGFVGQIQTKVQVKGCSAGAEGKAVTINASKKSTTLNLGGFVGVCYGTVTSNGSVHSSANVNITCANEKTDQNVNIGGFVGYLEAATVTDSDAVANMSTLIGQQVGGFIGFMTAKAPGVTVNNCSATVNVKGNNYTGGFVGNEGAANHNVTNNSVSGTVAGAATVGGFAGMISQGTWAGNSASCTVSGTTNIGGFAGQINGNVTVSRSSYSGETTATGNVCGGFTAIASNGATINDCYTTGTLNGATRKRGGIAGHVDAGTVSINRCYSTINISNNFEMGGLVGVVGVDTFTMTKCAAWNGTLVAASRASTNWSSAACIGVTSLACTLTDNYRSPNMDLLAYWGTNSGCTINLPKSFQHPDVSSTSPLTDPDGAAVTSSTMRPYQGKCDETKTLCQLASTTLGWSSDVWNFEGPLPILK